MPCSQRIKFFAGDKAARIQRAFSPGRDDIFNFLAQTAKR
jgi:hypothetical protein